MVVIVALVRLLLVVHTLAGHDGNARACQELLAKVGIARALARRHELARHYGVGLMSDQELMARALAAPRRRGSVTRESYIPLGPNDRSERIWDTL